MAAPSFSSFVPSFSSFPEVDPGPSKRTKSPDHSDATNVLRDHADESRQKSKKNKSERQGHRPDKEKKAKRDARTPYLEPDTARYNTFWVNEKVVHEHSRWESAPSFFPDYKGDPLNITYGSIHAGDLPKYCIVNRVCFPFTRQNN